MKINMEDNGQIYAVIKRVMGLTIMFENGHYYWYKENEDLMFSFLEDFDPLKNLTHTFELLDAVCKEYDVSYSLTTTSELNRKFTIGSNFKRLLSYESKVGLSYWICDAMVEFILHY